MLVYALNGYEYYHKKLAHCYVYCAFSHRLSSCKTSRPNLNGYNHRLLPQPYAN